MSDPYEPPRPRDDALESELESLHQQEEEGHATPKEQRRAERWIRGHAEEDVMNLEETLDKIAELSREELGIVRKRGEEKTAAREHGDDFHEMQRAADRLDHYAHQLRRLHDAEFGQDWRHESLGDARRSS